jgi:hypothetical protein
MTKDDFDRILYIRLKDETLQSIIKIPGVYEIVSKYFSNDILEIWEYEQYIKVKEIVERINLWNPDFQRTLVLLKLINELTEVLCGTLDLKLDKYINLRALPVREFFRDVVDKYSTYPIWTCDFEGSCLVGAEKLEIEPIDLILHRFEGE